MASPRSGELSAGLAVLGLLIQQPDTVAGVGLRLEEEHPGARWPRNIVHNTVPSLAGRGLVRIAEEGGERSLDRYEVTPLGAEHFSRWLGESGAVLPALRDAMRAKLRYVDDESQLARIVRDIRDQEDLCVREGEQAMMRYRTAQIMGRLKSVGEQDWRTRVRRALMIDEVSLWYDRAKALRHLREHLEDPRGDRDMLSADHG